MREILTLCFTFTFIQVAVGRAQSDDSAPLQSPIQSIPEPPISGSVSTSIQSPLPEGPNFSSSAVTDFSSEATSPVPIAPTVITPTQSSPAVPDVSNYHNVAQGSAPLQTTAASSSGLAPSNDANVAPPPNSSPATASSLPSPGQPANVAQTVFPLQTTAPTSGLAPANYASTAQTAFPSQVSTPSFPSSGLPAPFNYANPQVAFPPQATAPFPPSGTTDSSNYANVAPAPTTQPVSAPYYPNFPNAAVSPNYYPNPYMAARYPYASPYANQLAYGNMQYPPSSYYPQFPMGYATPQMPYGMAPNPFQYPPFLPPTIFSNQTQLNSSLIRNTSPFPQQFTPHQQQGYAPAPAPSTPDQSTPTVVSSTGESGTDLNSLPPQVKEFIDMIPQILSMQESSPPSPPQIKPTPLRKFPKTATSSLLKKKQYHSNYPQYPNYPHRYPYYY